jgi:hypothetical protein
MLRSLFLGTTSFLYGPNDKPGGEGGKSTVLNEDVGAEDDQGDAGGAEGNDDGVQDQRTESDGSDDELIVEDDDDPELADLPLEAKLKAKKAIAKALEREVGWRDRQIDRLYRKSREAKADNEALEQIADPARRSAPKAGETLTEVEINRRAADKARVMQYDRDCDDADARGRSIYQDKWAPTLAKLPKLGGVDVTDMTDIMATDKPHVVLFALANPDTYERVMALPPARRRNEFVKLSLLEEPKPRKAAGEPESKRPGDVPAPVVPISGGRRVAASQVNLYDDKAADDAWYAARNATRRKKFGNAE